jgi:Ran GTPase-activating protein (RanGAP) involved in mRNA processing and transport
MRNLESLNLRENNIGDKGAKAIGKALEGNETLKELDVSANAFGENGASALLPHAKIIGASLGWKGVNSEKWDISGKKLSDGDMLLIEPLLRTMPNLKDLRLSRNNIGDEGCRTIAPALRTMPNLKTLYLYNNNIGDEGLAVLSNVVPAIPLLDDLRLSGNKIGNVGCQCLLELIENDSLQSLTKLDLRFNPNISSEELKTKVRRVWSEKGKNPDNLFF